jgi:hypothetical protein
MAPCNTTNLEKRAVLLQNRPVSTNDRPRLRHSVNRNPVYFRLLDLSAELRNNVYDKIIEDSALLLRRSNTNRNLVSTSALVRVSRSLRSEFLPLALRATPVIKTVVRNWDFSHVVKFMNTLGTREFEKLMLEKSLVVDFCFSGENADPAGLMRWLDRFDDDKRGDGVRFEYVCTGLAFAHQNWGLASFRACTSGGPNGMVQYEKIAKAFRSQDSVLW